MKKVMKTLLILLAKLVQSFVATILSVLAYVLWVNVKVTIRDAIKGKFVYKAKIKEA